MSLHLPYKLLEHVVDIPWLAQKHPSLDTLKLGYRSTLQ